VQRRRVEVWWWQWRRRGGGGGSGSCGGGVVVLKLNSSPDARRSGAGGCGGGGGRRHPRRGGGGGGGHGRGGPAVVGHRRWWVTTYGRWARVMGFYFFNCFSKVFAESYICSRYTCAEWDPHGSRHRSLRRPNGAECSVPKVNSRHRLSQEQRCLCREHLALGKGCESGSDYGVLNLQTPRFRYPLLYSTLRCKPPPSPSPPPPSGLLHR
jgi:hypothetical protein